MQKESNKRGIITNSTAIILFVFSLITFILILAPQKIIQSFIGKIAITFAFIILLIIAVLRVNKVW